MTTIAATRGRFLARDFERYEGVRPVQVWGLRMFYLLMVLFVATDAWGGLLRHQGPWDPVRAAAVCVWAIGYKTLWWIFVGWPLWQSGTLAGSSAEEMAFAFAFAPVLALVVPWGYVWREYVLPPIRSGSRPMA